MVGWLVGKRGGKFGIFAFFSHKQILSQIPSDNNWEDREYTWDGTKREWTGTCDCNTQTFIPDTWWMILLFSKLLLLISRFYPQMALSACPHWGKQQKYSRCSWSSLINLLWGLVEKKFGSDHHSLPAELCVSKPCCPSQKHRLSVVGLLELHLACSYMDISSSIPQTGSQSWE